MVDRTRVKNRGFTLIELLVVLAIIGLLSSIVLTSVNSARAKARDARRYTDLNQVQLALELYYDNNGSYPVTTGWRSVCPVGGSHTTSGSNGYVPNLAPAYMGTLPTDPSGCVGGFIKGYIYNSDGTDYKFSADWSADMGTECQLGRKFADPPRTTAEQHTFCSIYTQGASDW